MRPNPWNDFLRRISIAPAPCRRRRRTGRTAALQSLEPRELLTASMELFNGSTQLYSSGGDSFGTVSVGAADTQYLTVKNVGSSTLTISSDSLPSGFSSSTSMPLSINAGQSATLAVSMSTGSPGSFSGPFQLSTNDPNNSTFMIYLSGTVQQSSGGGTIELFDGSTQLSNGGSDSFGSVTVGSSDTKSFTVDNTGSSSLSVSSVNLPSGYTLNTSLPLTIAPNQSSTLTVSLNTSTAGTYGGTMSVTSNSTQNNPFSVSLSGTVTAPAAPVMSLADGSTTIASGGNDSFGDVTQGSTANKTFTVKNTGNASLSVSAISLPSGYSLQTSLPLSVAAGGSTTFVVALNTGTIGTYSGTMSITDTDSNNDPYNVSLSGTVQQPSGGGTIELLDGSTQLSSGASDSFGNYSVGANAIKQFTVKDTGTQSLNVSQISLPNGFSLQSTPLPLNLSPGGSAMITVMMNTSTAGNLSGTMTIDSNDPNSPFTLNLNGSVGNVSPVITVYDGSTAVPNNPNGGASNPDDFGDTPLGTPLDKTFTIANSGSSEIAITAASLRLPPGFSFVGSWPATVSAHGSVPFTVQFDSTSAGTAGGVLSFEDGDPAATVYQFGIGATATVPHLAIQDQSTEEYVSNGLTDAFGTTEQGVPVEKTFVISNISQAPLLLAPTSLMLPTGFSLVGNLPATVAAGGTASFTLELNAAAAGSYSGTMSFLDNDLANTPFSLTLTGVVNAPTGVISVSDGGTPVIDGRTEIDFGTTNVGTPASQSFLIRNTGQAALSLDPQTLLVPAGFSVAQTFDGTLAPGASTTLVIDLSSGQAGAYGGTVSFHTGDPNHPVFTFFAGGQVNPPEPAVAVLDGNTAIANGANDNFGSTPLGTPIQQTITIENQGNAELNINLHSLVAPTGFGIVTPPAATVEPGGSTSMVVELDAAEGGNASGTLTFASNDPNNAVFSLNVSGQVLVPAMAVSNSQGQAIANNTGTLNFGSTPLSSPTTSTITIRNTGSEDLSLDPNSLTLPQGYSLVSAFASDVPPDGSTSLTIQFDATSIGQVNGQVVFHDSDPNNSPFSFAVTATAATPAIEVLDGSTQLVQDASDDFGSTTIGTPVEQTLTINNTGLAPLVLQPSSIIAPTGFSVVTPFASQVAPGSSTTLVVELNAASAGNQSGLLTFVSNDPITPVFKLQLSGQVLAPSLEVRQAASPSDVLLTNGASISLGTTTVGDPVNLTLLLGDAGAGALTLSPSSLSVPAGFSVVQTFAPDVASQSATELIVALAATAVGSYSGSLSFTSNDATQSPFTLSVSGIVNAPTLEVLDGSTIVPNGGQESLGQTPVGTPIERTLTIQNESTNTLTIDTANIMLPAGYALATPPAATIAAGASSNMVVELNAAAAGLYTGTFTLPTSDPNFPDYRITLNGTALAPPPNMALTDALAGTPIANGGSLGFGSSPQYTPVYKIISIENTTGSTIMLDPSTLVVPAGFSVFQAFDSSVAAGNSTALGLQLDAQAAGNDSGTVSFNYNDGVPETCSFTVSGTVTAPEPQDISLDQVELPNNIGPRAAETTADPTISGVVDGTFNGGSVVVQFDTRGNGTPDGATATITQSGTTFSFDPRSVNSSLVGYVGPVDVKYRTKITDSAGNVTYGAWTDFPFTMVVPSTQAHVDDLDLANNTGGSADDTYDPRVSGHVGGPFVGATVDVQFVVGDGSGNPGGLPPANPTITGTVDNLSQPGQTFTYDPVTDDTALVNYAGPVQLSYRTVEYDIAGNVVATGAWTTFGFTLYVPTPQASVSNFHLVDDTGTSNTDNVTSDPTVAGTVTGTFTNEVVEVQFSHHGDGHIDGLVAVTAVGTDFTYDPRESDPTLDSYSGPLPLEYRTVEFDQQGGEVVGAWTSFPITLLLESTSAVIDNLRLTDVTGAAGPPPTTDDPTVTGSVAGMQQSGIPKVQFDYNGDGIPDETATANSDGSFSDSLPGLAYGNVTIAARAVEFDPANGVYLYGAWTTLSFDYLPPPPPAISSLVLANVTDSGTGGTSDPTVKGTVAVGNASGGLPVEVQFDTTGSGQPDGQALADTQGNFSFTPIGLDYGTVTIAARTVEHGAGPLAYSPWLSLTFTYEPPPADAPTVQDFRLANPNLGSSSIAADPTVTGTVTFDNLAAGSAPDSLPGVPSTADMMSRDVSSRTVQFDTTGDGTPTASTATGPGGTFTFKPTGLAYGQVTIRARAVGVDSQGNPVYGDWTSLTFTYQQPPSNLATVSSLVLASPLPQVVGPGLSQTASDPTVNGQLAAPSGQTNPNATAFLAVEFDTNAGNESGGNYAPNATVQADANGNFTFTPTGLSYGPVTIAARVRQHDYTTGGFDYSAWTTLSFTYQAPTVTAASVTLSLVDNSGASGHTANPALKGTVTQGSGQNGTNGSSFIQISTTGNGVPDATVFPDANGNFAYTPADLAYGPTTIEARAVGWTSSGSGGYTYGPWTSLSFTYEQEAYAAPVLAALGLVDSDGNLNTQVNSSTTTAQPVVGGQLTYQGSVQGLTVEFAATNGGTPYASVTTDQYGNFSYVPTGLTPGEVTIYARTVSSPLPLGAGGSGAGSVLIGPWTPLTFTYVAPTVAPPTISGFTLASPLPLGDSGSSGLTATDPTVTGTASVGAALSGAASSSATHLLVIQFDTNGDGAPDATTVADSSGSFAWTPATLSPGQVTIQARAVDDDANGNAIYGSWVSLSFTLQAVAPSAGTIIGSLALSDNVGPSSTALVSSDGSISGQVVDAQGSTASTSGVTVEIDLADGGQPTATVTTDAQGNFSYTPPTGSLPEGAVTIQVRTVDQAAAANLASSNASGPAGGTYDAAGTATFSADASGGDWTSISFVLSSNPTNSSVQNQATTLAANLAAAALAASNDQSTNSSAASALAASAAASAGAYNTGVAKADADQQTSAAAAAAAYDAALASAQETYDAAMSQASGNFNSELASYSGDRTSYDSQPYQWPDAPPALPGPDETPATPPVQPPTFTGPQFDPAQDPAYSAAIAADQQAYDTAVEDAEGTYDSDVNDAATTQKNSVNAARDVERQAFAAADQQYQTALAAPNPTDLTSAAAAAHTAYQAAHDTYATAVIGADVTEWEQINAAQAEMVAASEAAQLVRLNAYAADLVQLGNTLAGITPPPPNLTGDALNAAGVAYGHEITQAFYTRVVSDAGADLTFATTVDAAAAACGEKVDAAIAEHDKAVSAAMAAELTAFDAANLTYLTAAAEWHRWDAQNRADADKIRQESYDQAEYNYGTAVALAAQTYSDSVALARQTRDDSIADALLTQQQDDAQTLAEAADNLVSGGSGGSGSSDPDTAAWNQYQATLALDESQYEESDASAQHTLSYEEDAAAYDDAIGVDLANLTRDETIALDKRTEKDTEAGAQDTLLVGQAANDKQRTVDDDTASKDANDAYADAEDAFDQAAIGYLKDLDDNVGKNTQAATDAFAGVVYDMAICTDPTSTVIAQFAAERQSIAQSLLTDNAQDIDAYIHNLVKSDLTRGTELTTTEDSLAGGLSSDMCDWLQQNDELLGIDEKDVGAALATQDEDDTGARDEADAQAANLAKIELDTDAPNEQAYDDNQATEQQTQDVADTEAQQGFEESEADNYVSQLDTWVQSLPTGSPLIASATEQYQQAQADDQWVHDATAAEVADVQAEDEAQVTWADAVDQQSEEQTADDAAAMAAAITASDDADAQRATTDDAAWTTEVQKLADVTTTYDQANALATSKLATSDADALETARDAWDAALGAQINTWADVMMNATISGDASGVQSQIAAANLTQLQAQEGASVTWADTCAGDQATYMKSLADAKGGTSDEPDTGWVAGITDAEAAYVAAAATAGAVETQSDAEAAAGMDETLALDEGSFEVELGDDNNTLDSSDGADQETLVHAEDECDAADEVGYAQANATYQDTLWSSYAGQLATAAAAGDPATAALAQYYASVALHQSQEISTDGADLVGEVNELTQADIGLADEEEAASVDQAADDDAAMQTETTTLVPQEEQAVDDADGDLVQAATEDSDAQAAYETSVADAVAQFYKDKAAASRLYDYAAADAGVALVTTMAPHVADYVVQSLSGQPITEDLGADGAAAIATYDESIHGALEDETTSYGDAEVAEATSIGEAQVALATSQGDDEVELTENEAQVSDTLESETLADDDTLNNAVTGDGETDAESAAGDEADTTSTEGTDEVATQELLAGAEATTAANLAGDQATYAITVAQIAADAAASYAQANPGDGQAQFDSLYAQGYVTWLTDLEPVFVANATAVADAAGADEVALVTTDVNLADQEATDNVDNLAVQEPQSADESEAIQAANDTYQEESVANVGQDEIGSAEADQTQMLDLAEAASAYIVACAQADKTHAIENFNADSNAEKDYKVALADASLTLTDSQADADQAWITGKAQADETFLTTDAEEWQTMSDDEAQTDDQYALLDDSETQSADDTVAGQESSTLKAEALADQTQGNADATAEAAFQIAQANETATVWNDIVSWASASGLPGLPWMHSQAGIAAAEAAWSVTAAANYQTYVAALGTAEMTYATDNAAQFDNEITTIDAADKAAANDTANTDETLSTTLTNDEAAFEGSLAEGGAAYQTAIGQSAQDYRQGVAQANHDLIVETAENNPEAMTDYDNEMADALEAKFAAIDLAYYDFATEVDPAMTLQGTDDADAEETDSETIASTNYVDIEQNNQAVDTYDDQESGDYAAQMIADATALAAMLTANANGSAAAIASFDQSNPSPWADLANWQAAALAIQQVGAAGAQLTQSTAQDNAQASEEQAQADATTAEDDAQAEAEATQTDSEAEAADAEALAQAETTEAVFTDLPDTLIAPSEGPAPTLAPDYQGGYEANDYYVHQTAGVFTQEWSLWGVGWEAFATAAPTFGGFASSAPLGTLDGNSVPDVAGGPYGVSIPFRQQDLVRNQLPQALNYQSAMHFSGGNAQLLELTDTPSNIGQGGYSQSPLPTTPASTQLANPVPVKSLSASLADVPAQAGSGGTSDGEGSSAAESGAEDTLPAKEQANVNNRTISADNARGQNSMQLRADKDMAWLLQLRARQADLSAIVSALTEDSGVVSRVSTGNGASKQWHTYDWSEALGYLKTTLKGLDANFAIATNTAAQAYNGTVGPGTSEEQLSNIAQTLDLVQAYVRVIHTAIWVSRNAPRNLGPAGFVNGAIDQANALYQSLESLKKGGSVNVDKVTTAAYSYLYDSVNKLGTAAALDWATKLFGAIVGVRGLLKAGATLLASVNGAPIGALEAVITQGGQIALRAKNGLIITLTQAQVEELAINGVVALEGGILVYSKAVDPNGLGRAAEAAVPGKQNTEHVPSPNQTADYRVPDRLSKVGLGEIKNHLRLSNTAQLKDYLKYAQQTGRTFTLWVRGNASGRQTILSGPLLDLVKQGKIIVKPIPGTGSWIQP